MTDNMSTFNLFIQIYHVIGFITTSLVCFNSFGIKIGSSKTLFKDFHNQDVKYPKSMILRRHPNYIAFLRRKIKHLYDLLKTSSRRFKHAFAKI